VNSLPKTVTRQRRGCELNPRPSAPESSTLTTRLTTQPVLLCTNPADAAINKISSNRQFSSTCDRRRHTHRHGAVASSALAERRAVKMQLTHETEPRRRQQERGRRSEADTLGSRLGGGGSGIGVTTAEK